MKLTQTLWIKSGDIFWHLFFASKTVRGWENISKHAVLKHPEVKHAKAKSMGWNNTLMLKVALTEGSPVFCSWIFASEYVKNWGSCTKNAFCHIDGLFILAAAQKTNGGGCRISRSGLKVLNKQPKSFRTSWHFFPQCPCFKPKLYAQIEFQVYSKSLKSVGMSLGDSVREKHKTPSRGETNSQALFHPWPPSTVSSPSPREPGKWRAYFYGNSNRHNSSVAVEWFSLDVHPRPLPASH